jgi:ketosteroid isomerase-like protein
MKLSITIRPANESLQQMGAASGILFGAWRAHGNPIIFALGGQAPTAEFRVSRLYSSQSTRGAPVIQSRRRWVQVGAVAAAALVASACGSQAPAAAAGEAGAVRAARAEQNAAIAARDLNRVASYWTDSVTVTAGLGAGLRGRAAYRRAFELDSAMVYERTPQQVVVSANWPLAWEQGTWTGRQRSGRDGARLLSGSYAAQWEQVNGRWLIRSELFVATSCQAVACRWPLAQQ